MNIYSDFLPQDQFNQVFSEISGNWFPWYFFEKSVTTPEGDLIKSGYAPTFTFRHRLYDRYEPTSNWHKIVDLIVDQLSAKTNKKYKVIASYANLMPASGASSAGVGIPHTDISPPEIGKRLTGVFYLDSGDAGTYVYKNACKIVPPSGAGVTTLDALELDCVVMPKQNSLLLFDCNIFHSAPASSATTRRVININIDEI